MSRNQGLFPWAQVRFEYTVPTLELGELLQKKSERISEVQRSSRLRECSGSLLLSLLTQLWGGRRSVLPLQNCLSSCWGGRRNYSGDSGRGLAVKKLGYIWRYFTEQLLKFTWCCTLLVTRETLNKCSNCILILEDPLGVVGQRLKLDRCSQTTTLKPI